MTTTDAAHDQKQDPIFSILCIIAETGKFKRIKKILQVITLTGNICKIFCNTEFSQQMALQTYT